MPSELGAEELHCNADELAAYFSGDMPDDEAEQVEAHLGHCAACKDSAEQVSEKSAAWFSWTPEAHREAMIASMAPPIVSQRLQPLGDRKSSLRLLWEMLSRPSVRIAACVATALLLALGIWVFARRGPERPPERAKQMPPTQVPRKEVPPQPIAVPRPAQLPVVATFLAADLVRTVPDQNNPARQNKNEVLVPLGGCIIRLDVRPDNLEEPIFWATIQDPDGTMQFKPDRVTKGLAHDGKPAVRIFFPSDRVRTGEFVLRLFAGPSKEDLQEVERYLFTVTVAPKLRP